MDKNHETQLLNDLDDALFRVLMNRVAEHEGAAALARNAQLNQDPDAALPPALEKKCKKLIRDTFAAKSRSTATKEAKAQRRIFSWKTLQKVAVVAILLVTTVSFVFAAFPQVRADVINMIAEVYEDHTDFSFTPPEEAPRELVLHPGWLPKGFHLTNKDVIPQFVCNYYEDGNGATLLLEKTFPNSSLGIDTEDAEVVPITIQGYDAQLITKNNEVRVIWLNEDEKVVYFVNGENIPVDEIVKVAKNLS